MLHNFTTSILNLILDMLGDIFLFPFFILMIIVLLICYLLFTVFIYCVVQCSFWPFLCVVVLALSFCHTLYTYICIFHCDENPNAWTVAGSSSLDQKTLPLLLFFYYYFPLLSVKYLTYLTGFHCPVDSVSLRTTLM